MDELSAELDKDYDNISICELCDIVDGKLQLSCLKSARSLDSFVDQFEILMHSTPEIFIKKLRKVKGKVLGSNQPSNSIDIDDILELIWQPAFRFCEELLESIYHSTKTLQSIDKHLKCFSSTLFQELNHLSRDVSKCLNRDHSPQTVRSIKRAVEKIQIYWDLCEYQNGARMFLELKSILNLDVDFRFIESRFTVEVIECGFFMYS